LDSCHAPQLRDYARASAVEWIEADGMGGIASSSIINANTRKQHGLLSADHDHEDRIILLANLQESLVDGNRLYDLATNAFFGAIHPHGYLALDAFTPVPWPTWRYVFDEAIVEKQIVMIHGEHTIVVTYTLCGGARPMLLVVRPLLAFRSHNAVRSEKGSSPINWRVSGEFVECRPFDDGPTLYIAHPGARVETVGLWYRGFVYEQDRISRVECTEDLFHPGYFELILQPNEPRSFVFSTPSPRGAELVSVYLASERDRREAVAQIPGSASDPFFADLLRAADAMVHEGVDGLPAIHAGLPWGEAQLYRGLIAFSGLLLTRQRFDLARDYLKGVALRWRGSQAPSKFAPQMVVGHMHPADVPLWAFVAVWRYWKATQDEEFLADELLPFLENVAQYCLSQGEIRRTADGLLEVGHEPGADYPPTLPLGTNALWYNAQMTLAELKDVSDAPQARAWRERARRTAVALQDLFLCQTRQGLADQVTLSPLHCDETVRASQILSVGLPFSPLTDPQPALQLIREHLVTPLGLRSLSFRDSRYVGNGNDVSFLPKCWSGSVDATWLGCYCDARNRAGVPLDGTQLFEPFKAELQRRGYGHISGAFAGDPPHEPCDYVASASALGEIMRIYARDILKLDYVV